MKRIESADNPLLKHIRKLFQDKAYRNLHGEFMIEGYKVFDSAAGVKTVILRDGAAPPSGLAGNAEFVSLGGKAFDALSDAETSQGVLGICGIPQAGKLEPSGRYVLLDSLQDPGNLGTIIRTAAAFGLDGVLLGEGCADPFSPKAARSSSGAVFRIPIIPGADAEALRGRRLIAADSGGLPLGDYGALEDFILVVGNEGRGISASVLNLCAERVAVPMPGGMESLNAAVSAGIILYVLTSG